MHATLLSFLGTAWIVRVSLVGASCIAEVTAFGYEGVHPCSRVTCLVAAGALTGAVSTTAGAGRWHLMFLTCSPFPPPLMLWQRYGQDSHQKGKPALLDAVTGSAAYERTEPEFASQLQSPK